MTLGGSSIQVERPRVRSADGRDEVQLATYRHFADRDPLTGLVLEQMLAGVSTRRFERMREPVGEQVEAEVRSTSKSAVSREVVALTRENLDALVAAGSTTCAGLTDHPPRRGRATMQEQTKSP